MPVKRKRDYIDVMTEKAVRDGIKQYDSHDVTRNPNRIGTTWNQGTGGKSPEALERMNRNK